MRQQPNLNTLMAGKHAMDCIWLESRQAFRSSLLSPSFPTTKPETSAYILLWQKNPVKAVHGDSSPHRHLKHLKEKIAFGLVSFSLHCYQPLPAVATLHTRQCPSGLQMLSLLLLQFLPPLLLERAVISTRAIGQPDAAPYKS